MAVVDVAGEPVRQPLRGWTGRVFHSERMTFAYWDIDGDAADLHEHHHPAEEVWHVLEGELALLLDGEEHLVGAGSAVIVPPDTPHAVRVVGPCRALVADTPRRDFPG